MLQNKKSETIQSAFKEFLQAVYKEFPITISKINKSLIRIDKFFMSKNSLRK